MNVCLLLIHSIIEHLTDQRIKDCCRSYPHMPWLPVAAEPWRMNSQARGACRCLLLPPAARAPVDDGMLRPRVLRMGGWPAGRACALLLPQVLWSGASAAMQQACDSVAAVEDEGQVEVLTAAHAELRLTLHGPPLLITGAGCSGGSGREAWQEAAAQPLRLRGLLHGHGR
jgi:hypothetical protein